MFELVLLVASGASAWQYSHLGINSQLWTSVGGTRLLVDPILVGELSFFDAPGLYSGKAASVAGRGLREELLAGEFDAVLLSQGWEDHAHRPTLRQLARVVDEQPIVGPPSARAAVEACGLRLVELDHGKEATVGDVVVHAYPGALLGPPWSRRENSLLATDSSGFRLYYEPHCDFDGLSSAVQADALVAPAVGQRLGLGSVAGLSLVFGPKSLAKGARMLQVSTVVALRNGDVEATGLLAPFVGERGSFAEARRELPPSVRLCTPAIGEVEVLHR